jgi:hypothetical protein
MAEEPTQQLNDCSDAAEAELAKLKEQISKIIEIKKKATGDSSGSMVLRQVEDALKTVENLEKIGSKLSGAIGDINKICQQAKSLLTEGVGLYHGGPGLAQGHGTSVDAHEKDKNT